MEGQERIQCRHVPRCHLPHQFRILQHLLDHEGVDVDEAGRTIVPTYDLHNRVVATQETSSKGTVRTSYASYDALNRKTSQTEFDGKYTTFSYATDGFNNQVTTSLTKMAPVLSTTKTTDPFGQTVLLVQPNGDKTSTNYDGWGNKCTVSIIPVDGSTTQVRSFFFDTLGRLTGKTEPERVSANSRSHIPKPLNK